MCFGNYLQGERRLTGTFRTVDFTDPAIWQAANTQRDIQAKGAGGDRRNGFAGLVAHFHDGALAELAFDLPKVLRSMLSCGCLPSVQTLCRLGRHPQEKAGSEIVNRESVQLEQPIPCIFEQY